MRSDRYISLSSGLSLPFSFRAGEEEEQRGIAVEVLSLDTRLPSEVDSYFVVPIQAPERFTERSLDEAAQEVIEEL